MRRAIVATWSRKAASGLIAWWFGTHTLERGGAIYRLLGIRRAKQLLMATVGRVAGSNYSLDGRGSDALRRFERWTIVNETCHLALCLLFAIAVGRVLVHEGHASLPLVLLGCLVNLYLVCLQRYNRARIRATLRRMETGGKLSPTQANGRPASPATPNSRTRAS